MSFHVRYDWYQCINAQKYWCNAVSEITHILKAYGYDLDDPDHNCRSKDDAHGEQHLRSTLHLHLSPWYWWQFPARGLILLEHEMCGGFRGVDGGQISDQNSFSAFSSHWCMKEDDIGWIKSCTIWADVSEKIQVSASVLSLSVAVSRDLSL